MGTVSGAPTRRYHGLLVAALNRDGLPTVVAGYPWFTDWGATR